MTILTGDCRLLMPDHGPFDRILADPPFGDTSLACDRRVDGWLSLARHALWPSGSMWVFGGAAGARPDRGNPSLHGRSLAMSKPVRSRGFTSRPGDPQRWVKSPPASLAGHDDAATFAACLTVDITPALHGRIEIATFQRGQTVADLARAHCSRANFPTPMETHHASRSECGPRATARRRTHADTGRADLARGAHRALDPIRT
jgi:hypothetical protein